MNCDDAWRHSKVVKPVGLSNSTGIFRRDANMKEYMYLNACCMYVTEDGVWFVQGMCPILYYYSFGERKITIAQPLYVEETYGTAYFSKIYQKKNMLYIIPNNASKIVIYDIINHTCDMIDVREDIKCNIYRDCYEYNLSLIHI